MINSDNYVGHAVRTDSPLTPELLARLQDPVTIRLLHAAIGLATESGELLDMLKKHIFYGRPLDRVNALEELGDSQWYAALAIDVLQTTLNDVLTMNIEKLRLRYPEKFTETCAVERDVTAERVLLDRSVGRALIPEYPYPHIDPDANISKRGMDWLHFSRQVLNHIESYTVPQYGDKGADQASDWTPEMLLEQVRKYINRHGRNARDGQQGLDFLKAAHYVQMAAGKAPL
jgi:hypothetical protein